MFGSVRDIATFKLFTKELVEEIISQEIGYYKIQLSDTPVNIYGESMKKYFIGPVLIPTLIVRGDFNRESTDYGPDTTRTVDFRFFKDHFYFVYRRENFQIKSTEISIICYFIILIGQK